MPSLIVLRHHSKRTALLLLVWLVFCVSALCSGLVHMAGSANQAPHSVASTSNMHGDMAHEHEGEHHASHQPQTETESGCCRDRYEAHNMEQLLSMAALLLSIVVTFMVFAISVIMLVACMQRWGDHLKLGCDPPTSTYPPLFLHIQRLRN